MTTADIHRRVLDNLLDGVLVVGFGGVIETLNPAGAGILGVDPDEAAGTTFGELFIAREGYDGFTELIVDAIGQRPPSERQVVEVDTADGVRSLSVAISYLRERQGADWEPVALIVVFSDITELRTLRETELRMAKAVEAQHVELQTAYRQVEERSEALTAALRKVRVAQGLGMVLVIAMFVGAGLWSWRPLDGFHPLDWFRSGDIAVATVPDGSSGTVTVRPRPVSRDIALKGHLVPGRQVAVRSQVEGTVRTVGFRVGQVVKKGDLLIELDLSQTRKSYHEARSAYLKARKSFETLENWDDGTEMSRARRSFSKAKLALEGQRNRINKSTFLFKQGLISASDHEDAKRSYTSQLLDFEAAEQELAAVRAKGGKEEVNTARLAMERARTEMLTLEKELEQSRIRAPIGGSVLAPRNRNRGLISGAEVKKGQVLLRIGDFTSVAAVTGADEIDVVRLKVGQEVSVTGNAFPGLKLRGVVNHVSSEAERRSRAAPRFEVRVDLEDLDAAKRAALRVGMSARLRIVTYSNPHALVVPIGAVSGSGSRRRVFVVDPKTGETRERSVHVGSTTRNGVEVTTGLKAGEKILVSDG